MTGVRLLQVTAAALLSLSCGESSTGVTVTAPGARLTIESPIAEQVVGDGVVTIKGSAVADGDVESIRVSRHYVYPNGMVGPDSSWYLYKTRYVAGPNGQVGYWDWKNSVQFSDFFRGEAGLLVVKFELDYRPPGAQLEPHFLSDTVPLRIYRKPTITTAATFPDTLYQRSLRFTATTRGLVAQSKVELSMDGGTPVTSEALILRVQKADSSVWSFEFPDTLAKGRHTLKFRLLDELGPADSVSRTFVTYVADAPYTVSVLPDRGGSDADALGLNAAGEVVGWAKAADGVARAVRWVSGAAVVLPMSATARSSRAYSINDAGDVVGVVSDSTDTAYCDRGALWRGATLAFVGAGTSYCQQYAKVINATGDVLVINERSKVYGQPDTTAWVVRAGGATSSLIGAYPSEMNAQGLVVGQQEESGGLTDLGPSVIYPSVRPTFGGRVTPAKKFSINATSQIVGGYNTTLYFSATPGSEALDLNPFLGSLRFSEVPIPVHVTDNATILAFHNAIKTAFLWRTGKTTRVRLTTPGYTLDRVVSMNDRGQIIGHATETSTGLGRAVLLNPAP